MPERITYHVTYDHLAGNWRVAKEASSRANARLARKADAVERAKQLAKTRAIGQVIVHRQDGSFQSEFTYGDARRAGRR